MIKVKSKVTIYPKQIAKINKAAQKALYLTADWLKGDVVDKEVIPFDKETLQGSMYVNDSHINRGYAGLTLVTPYARRMYFHPEYNFQTVNNRNAKGKWFEDWIGKGKYAKKVIKTYGYFLKEGTDVIK